MLGSRAALAEVKATDVWARATAPGQKVAGVYMSLRADAAARVLGVESTAARAGEIHSMKHEDGVMRMRKLDHLLLPAGEEVKLAPGGNHIMLFDIRQQLKPGARVPIALIVEEGGKQTRVMVEAEVRKQ